jgi:phenylacetate-CoA ligase
MKLLIEVKRGHESSDVCRQVASAVKNAFEVMPSVEVLPLGRLAAEFERSVKAPRFVDQRN